MTPLKAAMATLMKRRVALAAAIVAVTGAGAGIAVAAAQTSTPAAPRQLAASATPSPSPSAKAGTRARHPLIGALVAATARETGLSVTTIRSDLQAGQTLNQIAGSKAGDVESDVLAALRTRLDRAVDKGRLTRDQETDRLTRAKTRLDTLMATPLKAKASGTAPSAA